VALPILREMGLPATFFVAAAFLDGGQMWNDTVIEAFRSVRGPILDLSALDLGLHAIVTVADRRSAIDATLARLKYLSVDERLERATAVAEIAGAKQRRDLMLTSEQVRALAAAGMAIGGHTVTHPILAQLDEDTARREIADGRDALEAIVRQPIRLFAYPNGKPGVDYTRAHVRMVRDLGFAAAVSTSVGAARYADSTFELPRFTPWDDTSARWGFRLARNLLKKPERAAA